MSDRRIVYSSRLALNHGKTGGARGKGRSGDREVVRRVRAAPETSARGGRDAGGTCEVRCLF